MSRHLYLRADCERPRADHAWSAPIGAEWVDRIAGIVACDACDGYGDPDCWRCSGDGIFNADRGYSCICVDDYDSLDDAVRALDERYGSSAPLWSFAGVEVDVGMDGEPLVVPDDASVRLVRDEIPDEDA